MTIPAIITPSILRQACPELGADPDRLDAWCSALHTASIRFPIGRRRAWAHFLGQVGTESAGLTRLEENLNYSVRRLPQVWRVFRDNPSLAAQYANNPRRLANFIYGPSQRGSALGNTQAEDGWHFRGRGIKQLTGRANYRAYGEAIGHRDMILTRPELLTTLTHAALSAAWFWRSNGIADALDATPNEREAVRRITRIVTGSAIGIDDRMHRTMVALEALEAAP